MSSVTAACSPVHRDLSAAIVAVPAGGSSSNSSPDALSHPARTANASTTDTAVRSAVRDIAGSRLTGTIVFIAQFENVTPFPGGVVLQDSRERTAADGYLVVRKPGVAAHIGVDRRAYVVRKTLVSGPCPGRKVFGGV